MSPTDDVTLAISASAGPYSCALRVGDQLHSDAGADGLAPAVERLFAAAGRAPGDLDRILLDIGPGSYTGLRVAITFARTLQAFDDIPVHTATSLELLAVRAWTELGIARDTTLRPVLDARRGRYHHALLRLGEHAELVTPPAAVPAEELIASIGGDETLLVEESVMPIIEEKGRGCAPLTLLREYREELAQLLFHPLVELRLTEAESLEPLYLMGSYAD